MYSYQNLTELKKIKFPHHKVICTHNMSSNLYLILFFENIWLPILHEIDLSYCPVIKPATLGLYKVKGSILIDILNLGS
jgi:hypothetical protein